MAKRKTGKELLAGQVKDVFVPVPKVLPFSLDNIDLSYADFRRIKKAMLQGIPMEVAFTSTNNYLTFCFLKTGFKTFPQGESAKAYSYFLAIENRAFSRFVRSLFQKALDDSNGSVNAARLYLELKEKLEEKSHLKVF